ncbi:hypothetical protein [Enterococcus faecium]|uniref:hypothetical protein n=1 Tax=Enterococcus faecium TaxID=1352 RepID=UPI0013896D26|nr:hypothetical protein [Enterococcus faecium]
MFYQYSGILKTHNLVSTPPVKGIRYVIAIFINNLLNYLQYLFFPAAPLLIIKDDLLLSVPIAQSAINFGVLQTLKNLFPHGFLEIPNIFCFQFLSITMFYQLFFKGWRTLIPTFMKLRKIYLASLLIVLIAAIVEGIF